MPFFSDYGYYHGSAPFSSQYYSQLLPYPGSNSSRPITRVQPRNYNSIAVEQTLRAIRRGPGAVSARHYCRPVHINASEIDVTSPRRPSTAETAVNHENGGGGGIQRGRTVVRLHTKNKRTEQLPATLENDQNQVKIMTTNIPGIRESSATVAVPEEGLAKKGTIKRHTSAGIKVPVTDDRRPSVTDEILREQEALFDTMIMEEMEGQKERRKSYPADCCITAVENKNQQKSKETRKKSAAAAVVVMAIDEQLDKQPVKKPNWKLNYDVIIEESGIEPVSFTFKLNKTKTSSDCAASSRTGCSDNGKVDYANHKVALESSSHDDTNSNKKHAQFINTNRTSNDNSDGVCMMLEKKTKVVKKKIVVKKKVVKKKKENEEQQRNKLRSTTPSPPKSKKKVAKKESSSTAPAVITPFVRTSFGKTFISPSQVSSTKSKFEKPKPKIKQETSPPVQQQATEPKLSMSLDERLPDSSTDDDDDDDESSSEEESSSLGSGSSSESTYYDSDDYGDKRIACSNSSFDSGLPSSPVPASDPIGRNKNKTVTTNNCMSDNNFKRQS